MMFCFIAHRVAVLGVDGGGGGRTEGEINVGIIKEGMVENGR